MIRSLLKQACRIAGEWLLKQGGYTLVDIEFTGTGEADLAEQVQRDTKGRN